MRKSAEKNGVSVKAYAGSTGVLLAMNVENGVRKGLLGFAIERRTTGYKEFEWLTGQLPFPGMPHSDGEPIPTNVAPIQKFRWSDYRVLPGAKCTYRVHPVYGTPERPKVESGPEVTVTTESTTKSKHSVLFNRAAAASQAFSRKFPDFEAQRAAAKKAGKPLVLPAEIKEWLSRGVLEKIIGFIARAKDEHWALDIAIYEYELPEIVKAVRDAHRSANAAVRVVYHAKEGDAQTEENEANLKSLPQKAKVARLTKAICHDKFIVLSKLDGEGRRKPQAVLCGSTNFTENGVFRQANVVHVVEQPKVAAQYLRLFEHLFDGNDPAATKKFIDKEFPMGSAAPLFVGFSPRSKQADLVSFMQLVNGAERDVLFATVFDIHKPLLAALAGAPHDPILRYGIQNKKSSISGFHADRSAEFAATTFLNKGLEGFLKESTQGQLGNILIHTKIVVIDFTSAAPTVISGSHNLSANASKSNDENFLILAGDTDVADIYGCEVMRLYDHYRFRFHRRSASKTPARRPELTADDSWTERYFADGSLSASDRLRFAGVA